MSYRGTARERNKRPGRARIVGPETNATEAKVKKFMGEALVWGQGDTVLDVFLEPTCPHCGRAFGKLKDLMDAAGEDKLTLRIILHSQPWHIFSPVVSRAVLAAAATEGGKAAAWSVLEAVFNNREDFIAFEHCKGDNMAISPGAMLERIVALTGIDFMEAFETKALANDFKWHTKFARQNGIHGSPTFMVDGLVNDGMGSRDEVSKWVEDIGLA